MNGFQLHFANKGISKFRADDLEVTFKIAEIFVNDKQDLAKKRLVVGSGKQEIESPKN